ncbi:PREDICTED: protein YIPF6-like [Eufriesea mexicana]|uniref:protein YIPF6-like n=1 Tax=Eufriesea mexicana TaxID=516756 RepID=UPI00083BB0CB|nr:PREDICTED: protein YIPF6-like [Eufriesea mexicana]
MVLLQSTRDIFLSTTDLNSECELRIWDVKVGEVGCKMAFSRNKIKDVRAVGKKFYHVLYPKEKESLLKEWDLWGPLVLCTFMAMILQGSSDTANNFNDGGPEFAEVFVIVWIGSMVVTLKFHFLHTFMQCIFHLNI